MTTTEKMVCEMNGFFKALGEPELTVPKQGQWKSELELLALVQEQYKERLLQKMPQYRKLRPDAIPDMFLMALKKQEDELRSQSSS